MLLNSNPFPEALSYLTGKGKGVDTRDPCMKETG